mgnify:CR=1 FL=1
MPTKTTCFFSVGGDALIAPWGAFPERSGKTDTPIPSASGPMWASAPTKTTCVFSVGDDTLIAPWGASTERSGKTDMAVPPATGRCGHRPLQKLTCVFTVGGVTHKNNVCFQRRGRCPHRPAGCVSGAVRKNGHGWTVSRGPMWASAPTKNNARFQRWGRYPQKQRVFSA